MQSANKKRSPLAKFWRGVLVASPRIQVKQRLDASGLEQWSPNYGPQHDFYPARCMLSKTLKEI